MVDNNNKDSNEDQKSTKKTLTLGIKGKQTLEKLKEDIAQKTQVIKGKSVVEVLSQKNASLKSNLGDIPYLGQNLKKPTVIKEKENSKPESEEAEDSLTEREKKSRQSALEKSKQKSIKDNIASQDTFIAFSVVGSSVIPKEENHESQNNKNSDIAAGKDISKKEETLEEKAVKKKAAAKKKEKNDTERAWKDAYYEEEQEEDFPLELEESLESVAVVEEVVVATKKLDSVVQHNFTNTNFKRVGKTKKDKYGNKNKSKKEVLVTGQESVKMLSHISGEKLKDFLTTLDKLDVNASEDTVLDLDTAELVLLELGHKVVIKNLQQEIMQIYKYKDEEKDLEGRPPVVTIMGHVDHGKTTLLDYIRKTNVVSKESGGITQHIGAYQITNKEGNKITFLDTPGHEAFAEMRARGALVTDIIVLVVAADDGLKQQSVEVINHANSAGVPIVVAINKIDKPGSNSSKVKTELLQYNIVLEELGGKVLSAEVSALKGTGIESLLDNILLEAELLDLKANKNRSALATVIESKVEKGRGIVATLIIQNGSLRQGDLFVVGESYSKVRLLSDENGKQLKIATPSMPVEVTGFNSEVRAGDEFLVVKTEADAKKIIEYKQIKSSKQESSVEGSDINLLLSTQESVDYLSIILKSDVYGSKEAILGSLEKIGNNEVKVKVVHSGVGAINESDVLLAKTTGAIICGFNVRANNQAKTLANSEKVDIWYFSIIYDLLDNLKERLSGMLQPKITENIIGYAEVKEVFSITKLGKIAGCTVTEGFIKRSAGVRLLRNNVVIYEGMLIQLKRFKDEVKEVQGGQECGVMLQNFQDIVKGDIVECFEKVTETRKLK